MRHPSFSIVIPTYQRREVVCAAVAALCRIQYDGEVEIIVVVDGSTDGTAATLTEVECPFPVRVIEQSNRGASAARNRGAAEAAREVILFLDDDMISESDLLEQHARMYRDGADAVVGNTPLDAESTPGFLTDSVSRWIDSETVQSPLSPWDVFTGQLSVRKYVFEATGGFDEAFTEGAAFANEDADLGVRLLERFDVRHNPDAISRQRFVVTPREYMARAPMAVEGDLHFLTRNPEFSRELFDARGMGSKLGRYVYLPLSRLPLVPRFLAASALWAGEKSLKTPLRSSRLLARYFSGSRSVVFWSALRARRQFPGKGRLLVLCYHAIRDQSTDPVLAPYGVPVKIFASHLDALHSAGYSFVSPNAVANFLRFGVPLPKRAVLLTFDDCYEDLIDVAETMLQSRGIPAIAFAVTAMKSGTNEWDQAFGAGSHKLLTPDQLRHLPGLGVEVGSHSRTHREMPILDPADQQAEANGSAEDLAGYSLPKPRFFAYPFGAADAASREAVAAAGYLAAFGCGGQPMTEASDRLNLPRLVVLASDRGWRFKMKIRAPRTYARAESIHHRARSAVRKIGKALSGAH